VFTYPTTCAAERAVGDGQWRAARWTPAATDNRMGGRSVAGLLASRSRGSVPVQNAYAARIGAECVQSEIGVQEVL